MVCPALRVSVRSSSSSISSNPSRSQPPLAGVEPELFGSPSENEPAPTLPPKSSTPQSSSSSSSSPAATPADEYDDPDEIRMGLKSPDGSANESSSSQDSTACAMARGAKARVEWGGGRDGEEAETRWSLCRRQHTTKRACQGYERDRQSSQDETDLDVGVSLSLAGDRTKQEGGKGGLSSNERAREGEGAMKAPRVVSASETAREIEGGENRVGEGERVIREKEVGW